MAPIFIDWTFYTKIETLCIYFCFLNYDISLKLRQEENISAETKLGFFFASEL